MKQLDFVEQPPALGSPIRIQVRLRSGLLRPAWSAVCGALASSGLVLSSKPLLRLALLIFLVDVVWGGLWSALVAMDWATLLRRWKSWHRGPPARLLPYTSSSGPAGRLARSLGHLSSWWVESVGPSLSPIVAGLVVLLPLAVVGAGVLGVRPLFATLAAISLLQFVFLWTRGAVQPVPGAQALFEIALPWLAGHALFDIVTFPSTVLALAYALSYAGGLRVAGGQPGLARWNLGQGVAVILLVVLRQPLAAGAAGLLLVAQATIQPWLFDAETDQVDPAAAVRFIRVTQPWLIVTMLIAAWGIRTAQLTGG